MLLNGKRYETDAISRDRGDKFANNSYPSSALEDWCWRPAAFWWKSSAPPDVPSHCRPRGARAVLKIPFRVRDPYIAGVTTTAINIGLIMAMSPIVVLVVSWSACPETIARLQRLGIVMALIGGLFVMSRGRPAAFFSATFASGDVIALRKCRTYSCLQQRISGPAEHRDFKMNYFVTEYLKPEGFLIFSRLSISSLVRVPPS
jgi:hypothetical protein